MSVLWAVLAVYVVGWIVTARLLWIFICDREPLEGDDWFGVPAGATLWPIVAVIAAGRGLVWLITQPLPKFRMPRQRRQANLDRIRELEYELGLVERPRRPGAEALNASHTSKVAEVIAQRQTIIDAGYEPIRIDEYGHRYPRYVRGGLITPAPDLEWTPERPDPPGA